jgi:predicted DNA-binding protein
MPPKPNVNLFRDELEDQEDLKLADKAMREMRRGGVKATPMDQVIKNINLAAAKQAPQSDTF